MTTTVVCARVDLGLKQIVEAVLAPDGLTLSEAFRQMMLHTAREKKLPFTLLVDAVGSCSGDDIVTAEMRYHAGARTQNYFGFRGFRAAISHLYAAPQGATQAKVNEAAAALGSPQKNYLNMLSQARKWGHEVIFWSDPARGGLVYKLIYNPDHSAPGSVEPPSNWHEMNAPELPPGVTPRPYRPYRS
jgi:addiction module RelB/DinJ family antitoxin